MKRDGATILLVDDEEAIRLAVGDWLQAEGYAVVDAASAEQALGLLEQVKPDLTILDLNMPGMGGVGFLRAMPKSSGRAKYPVLIFSAGMDVDSHLKGFPVDGIHPKSGSPRRLLQEVTRIIERRRLLCDHSADRWVRTVAEDGVSFRCGTEFAC